MNKRISIKRKRPLMAIFALSLLVSLTISSINPMASVRVSASGYDLPVGDHEGFPMRGASKTVASDYNPLFARTQNSMNAARSVSHGYYYEKLNMDEKRDLYNGLYIACDSSRRLKKSDKFPTGDSETEVVNKGGYLFYSGSKSRDGCYNSNSPERYTVVNEAIEALCYDHMTNVEYYMCDWRIYEFKTENNVYRDYIIMKEYTTDDYDKLDQATAAKAKEYAGTVKSLGLVDSQNVAVTVLNVHDWYTKQLDYGSIGNTGDSYFNLSHTAYGALCKGRAVCDGYSLGYALILNELGINAKVVTGNAKTSSGKYGGHAWNMVNIGGDWYEEDTTWADASKSGKSYINHAYYNKTTAEYKAGIEGSIHVREIPYGGRLIDEALGTKYTYEVSLALLSGQVPQYPDDSEKDSSANTDSTNDNNSDNNTTTTPSYNGPVMLEAQSIVCEVNSDQTVAISGVADNADTTLDIPSTVVIDGKEYPVTEIEAEAFKGNKNIHEITGGHNIVTIGKAAFSNCKNLRTVDLSQTDVKTIGAKAFNGCSKLKKVKLNGDYLKKVGSKAFNKLNKEVKITIYARNKKTYNKLVTKVTKAGAKNAKFKSKKSLGIKYN